MKRPAFQEDETVMICKHIFEDARRGKLYIDWDKVTVIHHSPPTPFTREDGTHGLGDWNVFCAECSSKDARTVDLVEEFWKGGMLHVADFCRPQKRAVLRSHGPNPKPRVPHVRKGTEAL